MICESPCNSIHAKAARKTISTLVEHRFALAVRGEVLWPFLTVLKSINVPLANYLNPLANDSKLRESIARVCG